MTAPPSSPSTHKCNVQCACFCISFAFIKDYVKLFNVNNRNKRLRWVGFISQYPDGGQGMRGGD